MSYEKKLEIIQGLRRAFERFKHHEKFTKRVKPIIQAELPGYTVHADPADSRKVGVWGNGVEYNDTLSVWVSSSDGATWQERFAVALDRADQSDYAERAAHEEKLAPALDKLARAVREAREKAAALIEALPVPKSAKVRAEAHFWDTPSYELKKRYPELF